MPRHDSGTSGNRNKQYNYTRRYTVKYSGYNDYNNNDKSSRHIWLEN